MKTIFLLLLIAAFPVIIYSCGGAEKQDSSKINFDLNKFTKDGILLTSDKESSGYIDYEFCIPAGDEYFKEVSNIDSTLALYKTSKGRSKCSDLEWLCIGSSHQKNFKDVILALAKLSYIRQISQTFWE